MISKVQVLTSVEGILAELLGELHEVTLDKTDLVLEASIFGVLLGARDLVLVVVQADDVDVSEARNFTRGTAHTAADVEHPHSRAKRHLRREVVFVAGE